MTHKVNIQHLHFLSSHLSTRMQTTPTLYCQIFTNIEQKSSTRFSSFEFMKSQRHTNQNLPKIWVKNFEIALFFLFLSLKTKTFLVTKQTMWFKSVNCTFSNKTPKSFTLTPTHTAAHRHTQSQITPHLLTITYTKPHTHTHWVTSTHKSHTQPHPHTKPHTHSHTTTSPHKATHTHTQSQPHPQSYTYTLSQSANSYKMKPEKQS